MWKTVLAGTTVLAIAGATLAYAQSDPEQLARVARWRPSAEDVSALGDAHIAALHAGLKLNAEQEKNWPVLEAALRELAKQRAERFAERTNAKPDDQQRDPIERLAKRAQALESRGAALRKLADAAGPLYKSLDESQKHRFMMLARLGGNDRFGNMRGREWRAHWRQHSRRGPMMDGPMMDHPQGDEQPR